MKNKTIKYKPGKITLYSKSTDKHFGGSLIIKNTKKSQVKEQTEVRADILAEVLQENFSHNLDAIIQSLHIKNAISKTKPENNKKSEVSELKQPKTEDIQDKKSKEEGPDLFQKKPRSRGGNSQPSAVKKIIKEYWDLLDFPALFKHLFHISSGLSEAGARKLKPLAEKLFYSEDKGQESPKTFRFPRIPNLSFKLPYQNLAIAFLIVSVLSISSILLPLAVAKINSLNQQARAEETAKVNQKLAEKRAAQLKLYEYDPAKEESISKEFKLFIPKIGLESDISPSVDLDNEEVYKQQLLSTGVAHGKGSYFPGQNGSVFLFAHSTDSVFNIAQFNAKFFSLGELQTGDDIEITYRGKQHKYKVSGRVIIDPAEVDLIRESGNSLILMTCTPPGTDWQRLIIFADEADSSSI